MTGCLDDGWMHAAAEMTVNQQVDGGCGMSGLPFQIQIGVASVHCDLPTLGFSHFLSP